MNVINEWSNNAINEWNSNLNSSYEKLEKRLIKDINKLDEKSFNRHSDQLENNFFELLNDLKVFFKYHIISQIEYDILYNVLYSMDQSLSTKIDALIQNNNLDWIL